MDGIITLNDLKKDSEIYVDLNYTSKIKLKNNIKRRYKTLANFSREIGLSLDNLSRNNNLIHFFEGHKIRLPLLFKITKPFRKEFSTEYLSENIHRMGSKRWLKEIIKPKLPFNFKNKEGARVISAILHDGGISKVGQPHYRNNDEKLKREVVSSFGSVFGQMPVSVKGTALFFPKVIGQILTKLDGIEKGKKTHKNPGIPKFIFSMSNEIKSIFLAQAFDDDGGVDGSVISIGFNIDSTLNKIPNLLLDNKKLLEDLNIIPNKITLQKKFKTKKREKRSRYIFTITGRENLEKFYNKIPILISYKKEKLRNRLNSYKQYQLRTGEAYKRIKSIIYKNFKEKEFTIKGLSKAANLRYDRTKQLIWELEENKIIKRTNKNIKWKVKFKVI